MIHKYYKYDVKEGNIRKNKKKKCYPAVFPSREPARLQLVQRTNQMTDRSEAALRRTSSLASHVAPIFSAAAAAAVDDDDDKDPELSSALLWRSPTSSSSSSSAVTVDSPAAWEAMVGTQLGPGGWITVNQDRVDAFAECTMDHQWIHKAGAKTSFGGPIAHGLLSLSLLPKLMEGRAFCLFLLHKSPSSSMTHDKKKINRTSSFHHHHR